MNTIVALKNESLDDIVLQCRKDGLITIAKSLEQIDRQIASELDHNRFVPIRNQRRVILSSLGIIEFRRRYYYDKFLEQYIYPLDNILGIPKSSRITNELRLKILELSSIMTYKEVGQHLCEDFSLSKSSIYRFVKDTIVQQTFEEIIDRGNLKVHVQIDEKFVGMVDSINKKRYYTATIFAGKKVISINKLGEVRYQLLNKTNLSSAKLNDLKDRINYHLKTRYKVLPNEEIFLSGDYANYIKNFKDDIFVCKVKYVPDKFHTFRDINKTVDGFKTTSENINDIVWQNYLISKMGEKVKEDPKKFINANKVLKVLKFHPELFKTYLDKEYLGCSQESQNSHIYAPRFGKYANRFRPETIEKLSLIMESKKNNSKIILGSLSREIPERIDLRVPENLWLNEKERYYLDTSEMKNDTLKLFNSIKYGDNL